MPTASFSLVLLSAIASTVWAQDFKLGIDHTAQIATGYAKSFVAAATDSEGFVYVALNMPPGAPSTLLMKLTPAGDGVVWQTTLGFAATAMAVDAEGNVYAASYQGTVAKLSADGQTAAYQADVGATIFNLVALAVDGEGRLYMTGSVPPGDLRTTPGSFQPVAPHTDSLSVAFAMRLKPDGEVDYSTYLGEGFPVAIAADGSGSAFVAVVVYPNYPFNPGAYSLVTRLTPDGSGSIYSVSPGADRLACCLAASPAGDAVAVFGNPAVSIAYPGSSLVVRLSPQGDIVYSRTLAGSRPKAVALDEAGDAYVALAAARNFPAKKSLKSCSTPQNPSVPALAVMDGNGEILQATYTGTPVDYVPYQIAALVLGGASTVDLIESDAYGTLFMAQLSPNAAAQTVQIACITNSADYRNWPIAAGEMVSLFGDGLGPADGAQPQVTRGSGYPTQLSGVQVTFNGIPAPVLYVQESQINAVVPFSLASGATADICVSYNGVAPNCLNWPVTDAQPGVFTTDGIYAFALNQDGSVNTASNPAKAGSVVSIWATGLGPISPPEPDGAIIGFPLPVNVLPAAVGVFYSTTLFGPGTFVPYTVTYAGPAPFALAGVSQINFVATTGDSLVLESGSGSCVFSVHVTP